MGFEVSDVAADVAAFLAADTTDVLAADTTDVLSAAKGVCVCGGYLYGGVIIPIILTGFGYGYSQSRSTGNSQCISRGDVPDHAAVFDPPHQKLISTEVAELGNPDIVPSMATPFPNVRPVETASGL